MEIIVSYEYQVTLTFYYLTPFALHYFFTSTSNEQPKNHDNNLKQQRAEGASRASARVCN
jgi:hypothetical protein